MKRTVVFRSSPNQLSARTSAGFTLIEIALCIAIIGFGLVAIIGVLPAGLNVRSDNRTETIINQEASIWVNAIRSGASGYDDLTNYVVSITNYWTTYEVTPTQTNVSERGVDGYTRLNGYIQSPNLTLPEFGLVNGSNIIGLLTMPRVFSPVSFPGPRGGDFQSNYVVAYVRAISGSAAEKFPQTNSGVLDLAFQYRMVVEVTPYVAFDWDATNYTAISTNNTVEREARERFWLAANALQQNSYDVRLLFRWPILGNGNVGIGRQTFRVLATGEMLRTNVLGVPNEQALFFLRPSSFSYTPKKDPD